MAIKIKPPYGVVLHRGHPLARGLAGAWVFNEGRGDKVWDLSGSGHTGTLTNMAPLSDWVGGPHGHALDFDGTDDRVIVGPEAGIDFGTANACIIRLQARASGTQVLVGHKTENVGGYFLSLVSGGFLYYAGSGATAHVTHGLAVGDEVWLGVSREGPSVTFYKNGVPLGTTQTLGANNALAISSIGAYRGGTAYPTNMRCDYVYCWGRALSAGEMAWLCREPFCFIRRWLALPLVGLPGGTIHEVCGSAAAISSAGATAVMTRTGDLPTGRSWPQVRLVLEASWLREAILNGMTDAGMRLGTVLTQGWFWTRRNGCSAVYRLESTGEEFFVPACPVCVTAADARQALLPAYLPHEANSTCGYLVRRFNSGGYQDHTTDAQVCVPIGPDGQLAAPAPNRLLGLKAGATAGDRVGLAWFYCPLDQKVAPQVFHVYGDGGAGDIDFVHPLASLPYEGRGFYRWQSPSLESGKYLFAVRAESAAGVGSPPQASLTCEIKAVAPGQPGILDVEAI